MFNYPRRNPVAFGYLVLLAVTYVLVHHVLAAGTARRFLLYISTNQHNLSHHPIVSMLGSLLVADTGDGWLNNALVVGGGIALCLAGLERWAGSIRAVGVFLLGHVIATLGTAAVIVWAIDAGRYPADLRHTLDYGVSYGAIAVATAVTPLLVRWLRPLWAGFCVLYPLTAATWFGLLPDFTTLGHICAAIVGLPAGFALSRRSVREVPAIGPPSRLLLWQAPPRDRRHD